MSSESVQYMNHVWLNVPGWQGVVGGWSFLELCSDPLASFILLLVWSSQTQSEYKVY